MRRPHALLLLLAAAFSGAACRGRADGPRRIVVADVSGPALGLVFIAEQKGFFAGEGLAIDYQHFDLGRDALASLLRGRADVAMAYLTPVARRAFDDPRLRILTTLHHSHENTAVVARSDRGIRSVADLRGKRIGRPPGTNTVLLTRDDVLRAPRRAREGAARARPRGALRAGGPRRRRRGAPHEVPRGGAQRARGAVAAHRPAPRPAQLPRHGAGAGGGVRRGAVRSCTTAAGLRALLAAEPLREVAPDAVTVAPRPGKAR